MNAVIQSHFVRHSAFWWTAVWPLHFKSESNMERIVFSSLSHSLVIESKGIFWGISLKHINTKPHHHQLMLDVWG